MLSSRGALFVGVDGVVVACLIRMAIAEGEKGEREEVVRTGSGSVEPSSMVWRKGELGLRGERIKNEDICPA